MSVDAILFISYPPHSRQCAPFCLDRNIFEICWCRERERYPQYEFGHSLQRRDGVKKTRRQIVWNGFLESSISDPGNFPQGRQTYPFSRALLHTSMYKIVFPKLDPLKDRKRVQTYYLFVQAMNQPPGSAW